MSESIQQANNEAFEASVSSYEVDYWRADENRLVENYFTNQSGKLLVVGCGAGRTLGHLSKKRFSISAVDIAEAMVQKARENYGSVVDDIQVADVRDMPFTDDSFDYVFFPFHGLDSVPDRLVALKEIRRVLRPKGVFIFNSHNLFFPRSFRKFVLGKRKGRYLTLTESGHTVYQYHATFKDKRKLLKLFSDVIMLPRTRLQGLDPEHINWKDKLMLHLPLIDKSLYFVCTK